jgi:RNA polymerase sigma-70 factor, ECF subfamily
MSNAAAQRVSHLKLVGPGGEPEGREQLDTSDFESVFARFAPYVARIGVRLLGRDDEVDDLVQDVFMIAYRKQDQLRDPAAIKGWLATTAVRSARRRLKMRGLRRFVGLDEWHDYGQLADASAGPEEHLMVQSLFAALDDVPTDARIAWTLHHLEGKDLAEVAALTSCSTRTVKRRLAEARSLLQAVWND